MKRPTFCSLLIMKSAIVTALFIKVDYGNKISIFDRTYAGKLRNPVSRRYLCVKNNDLLSKPGFFA